MLDYDRIIETWDREFSGVKMNPRQILMLDAIMAYQKDNIHHEYCWAQGYMPEPLHLGLGSRAGHTTLHRALKLAHPREVVSMCQNSMVEKYAGLEFGDRLQALSVSLARPHAGDLTPSWDMIHRRTHGKILVLDGALHWFNAEVQAMIRGFCQKDAPGQPKYVIALGV